jgi:adenine-specific DNA-methyltransferase
MAERLLQLDDVRRIDTPDNVALLFQKIGYQASAQQLAIGDLELPSRSAEAIWDAYMIANHQRGSESLQVLLFHLHESEWQSPSVASNRMRSLAQSLCRRASDYLLLGTKNYNQLMLVNPRKNFDADMNLKVNIRKLLIDRTTPTNYDRDRLEAIAAKNLSPQELYKVQCEAFDVEKLTKEFYRGYREIFEELQRVIKANNPHPYFNDPNRLHQFSQRLLGRVMFLYFLQKKEFLGGDSNFLKNQYNKLRSDLEDTDFYNQVLEPLFFEMLNKQRPDMDSPWGKIPYLNGGLFDRDYGSGVIDTAGVETPPHIELPNSVFDPSGDKGILKFFNSYNFTISENVQGDEDVAVDPEMLGKVFENMLAAEERGQSGTFYTPRGIVQFMCVESLSRYLADQTGMDLEAVKKLTEYDSELPGQDINQLLTKEQAKKLKKALDSVKICDPAVGSGAFPMGMMQVILSVKQAIARREGMTVDRGSLTISQWKRDIIANNLYGVDIKPEAVEIAKLRMWLSLVVDIPDIDDVEPLPNLDYKLMCGDSLISTIHGEQLIPDPTKDQQTMLNVTPVQAAIQPLIDLQHQYFEAHAEERKAIRERIIAAEKNVFRVAIADRRSFWVGKQKELENKIKLMKGKVSKAQEKERQQIADKLAELDKFATEVEKGMRSLNFFQWHLHFNEVFQQQGGFDIVIGNPPYVRIQELQNSFPEAIQYYKANYLAASKGNYDIYVIFVERGLSLLHQQGNLTFILPHKFFNAQYGQSLRKIIAEGKYLEKVVYFGDEQVFDSATTYVCLLFLNKKGCENLHLIKVNDLILWRDTKKAEEKNIHNSQITESNWNFSVGTESSIFEKLANIKTKVKDITEKISQGIRTSANQIYVLDVIDVQIDTIKVYSKQLETTIELEKDLVSLFLEGRQIKPFYIVNNQLQKVIIIPYKFKKYKFTIISQTEMQLQYPKTFSYLQTNREILEGREKGRMKGENWYAYVYPKNLEVMQTSKIIIPDIANRSSFALDEEGRYTFTSGYGLILKNNTSEYRKYILGLLNSKVLDFYMKKISTTMRGGFFRYFTQYIEQLPIPQSSEPDRLAIEALVQKCLDAKGQGVEEWEAEIDDRVAYLYGLTAEEMKIIRGE